VQKVKCSLAEKAKQKKKKEIKLCKYGFRSYRVPLGSVFCFFAAQVLDH